MTKVTFRVNGTISVILESQDDKHSTLLKMMVEENRGQTVYSLQEKNGSYIFSPVQNKESLGHMVGNDD